MNRVFPIPHRRKTPGPTHLYKARVVWQERTLTLTVESPSKRSAERRLREILGRTARVEKVERNWMGKTRVSPSEMARLITALRSHVGMGASAVEALQKTLMTFPNPRITASLVEALHRVREGYNLSDALATTGLFEPQVIEYIRMAENTGNLEEILGEVAAEYRVLHRLKVALNRVLVYPKVILVFGILGMAVFRYQIYRVLLDLYADLQQEPPVYLEGFRYLAEGILLLLPLLVLSYPVWRKSLHRYYALRRYAIHRFLMRVPKLRSIIEQFSLVRLMAALYTSTRAGLAELPRYRMLAGVTWFEPYRQAFHRVVETLEGRKNRWTQPKNAYEILHGDPDFPPDIVGVIENADRTGDAEIFRVVRDIARDELQETVEEFGQWMEITMIAGVGLAVLFMLLVFYFPYYQTMANVG